MKKIRMLKTEMVATQKGPVIYAKGSKYDVEDWIASSLLGRGLAVDMSVEIKASISKEELERMTVAKLRKIAQKIGIPNYNKIRKELLIESLSPLEPNPENFEPIPTVPAGG